jgi:uncharacterized repeat protein (TIGR03833 family)
MPCLKKICNLGSYTSCNVYMRIGVEEEEKRNMNGTKRENIQPGLQVFIVLKKNQRSGKLTEGIVKDILTKSPIHHHGIKVRLKSGEIGRVKEIIKGHNAV